MDYRVLKCGARILVLSSFSILCPDHFQTSLITSKRIQINKLIEIRINKQQMAPVFTKLSSSLQIDTDKDNSSNVSGEGQEQNPLRDIRSIELLPELFELLLSINRHETQAKDFDNNLGAIRIKVSTLLQKLQMLEGIDHPINEQKASITHLNEIMNEKLRYNTVFKEAILLKLKD